MIRKHECRRRRPAVVDVADAAPAVLMHVAARDDPDAGAEKVQNPLTMLGRDVPVVDVGLVGVLVEKRLVHEERDRPPFTAVRGRREERPLLGLGRRPAPEELDIQSDQHLLEAVGDR